VVVEGTPIRYVEAGQGPPVILLHGLGASFYAWRGVLETIARAGYRAIAFDNRGFGFSGRPWTGYGNDDYVRLLASLLDSLGVPQAALVGHSMGGQIAAEFALAYPHRVTGLALLAPAGFGIRFPWLLRVARWPVVGGLAAGLRGRWITGVILRSTFADPTLVSEADVDQYYAPVADPDYGRALRGVLRSFRFDGLVGRADSLDAPTLLIWGARDRIISREEVGRLARSLNRVAFLTLPDVGHELPEEAPGKVGDLLVAFLTYGLPRVPGDLARHQVEARQGPRLPT
jgi:pimeloyl-ACP methyl ester carboxylesterase